MYPHKTLLILVFSLTLCACAFGDIEGEGEKTTVEAAEENTETKEASTHASVSSMFLKKDGDQCVEGDGKRCSNDKDDNSDNSKNNENDKSGNSNDSKNNENDKNDNSNESNDKNDKGNESNDKEIKEMNAVVNSTDTSGDESHDQSGVPLGDFVGPIFQNIHLALPRRENKEVGHEEVLTVNGRAMTVKQLSETPPIFEISNFLSANETELIMDMVDEKGMADLKPTSFAVTFPNEITQRMFDEWDVNFDGKISIEEFQDTPDMDSLMISPKDIAIMVNTTGIDKDMNGFLTFEELRDGGMVTLHNYLTEREKQRSILKRKGVKEAWLWHDEDELLSYENLLEDYHQRIKEITGIPIQLLEHTEPLQIQKREVGSFSHCQYDSPNIVQGTKCCVYGGKKCQMCRYASLLIFLNDVDEGGDVLFPLAADEEEEITPHYVKEKVLERCEPTPNKTSSSLVVPAQRGKALLWYNHQVSQHTGWMGHMDPQSIVGMTPVVGKKEQWTAKMWIDIVGDGVKELRPWRIGTNWLSDNNKHAELIETMRNDYFQEGGEYIHQYRTVYRRDKDNDNIMTFTWPTQSAENFMQQSNKKSRSTRRKEKANRDAKRREFQKVREKMIKESPTGPTPPPGMKQLNIGDPNDDFRTPLTHESSSSSSSNSGSSLSRYMQASLLLVQELSRSELETIARSLYDRLQYQCVPVIVSPLGHETPL